MVRFIMLGGFLGAGKTTAIGRLASHYTDAGLKVGIVTNDQAYDLVDTRSLRAQGFDVGEVPGACFCCKFDELVDAAESLSKENHPDVILTEPVGSCTDLVATVIEPLQAIHGDEYQIAPLIVFLKPEHGKKILGGEPGSGFSPKASYIFLKQIEEADVIAINKVDKLDNDQRETLADLLRVRFPNKPVVLTSGKTGEGFGEIVDRLQQSRPTRDAMMNVDYDIYAEGEAELGWLNCRAEINAHDGAFQLDSLAQQIVERIRDKLASHHAETAHLKVLAEANDHSAIANLVGSDVDVELSVASHTRAQQATLVVNARVVSAPELLDQIVVAALNEVSNSLPARVEVHDMQRFRPGRPTPTHRVTSN